MEQAYLTPHYEQRFGAQAAPHEVILVRDRDEFVPAVVSHDLESAYAQRLLAMLLPDDETVFNTATFTFNPPQTGEDVQSSATLDGDASTVKFDALIDGSLSIYELNKQTGELLQAFIAAHEATDIREAIRQLAQSHAAPSLGRTGLTSLSVN